jgi:predicted peptidase
MKWKKSLLLVMAVFSSSLFLEARTWTSSDGRTIEADYLDSDEDSVRVRFRGGRVVEIPFETLSEKDRAWALEQAQQEAEKENEVRSTEDLTGEWLKKEENGLQYRLYGGKRLREKERYPLVIYLHGRTGNVMEPERPWELGPFVEEDAYRKRSCIIFSPQSPDGGQTGWHGDLAEKVVTVVKRLIKELPVDENRVYLTGFSMGGYGTFHLLSTHPELFAAGVPIAGGGNPSTAENFSKVPVWVFHGDQDDAVDVEQSRKLVAALEDEDAPVKYTEMKGKGHGIVGEVYQNEELHEWLFEQVKP